MDREPLKAALDFWNSHGTKLLGTAAAIVASLLLVPDLIPADHMKWWQAANAVLGALTVKRGFVNSQQEPL